MPHENTKFTFPSGRRFSVIPSCNIKKFNYQPCIKCWYLVVSSAFEDKSEVLFLVWALWEQGAAGISIAQVCDCGLTNGLRNGEEDFCAAGKATDSLLPKRENLCLCHHQTNPQDVDSLISCDVFFRLYSWGKSPCSLGTWRWLSLPQGASGCHNQGS